MVKVKSISSFVVLAVAVCFFYGCSTVPVQEETAQENKPVKLFSNTGAKKQKTSSLKKEEKTPEIPLEYETTKEYAGNEKDKYYKTISPAFDKWEYIILGMIFLESKVTIDVNGERNGSEITNYMLMQEAQKIGGDDVINVRINEKEESKVIDIYDSDAKFIERKYKKKGFVYTATALAIKYIKPYLPSKNNGDTNVKAPVVQEKVKSVKTVKPEENLSVEKQEKQEKKEVATKTNKINKFIK